MRWLVMSLAAVFALALIWAVLDLPPAAVDLRPAVIANLDASGVQHPVTAVLLNYRGYDTLLEIAVVLLAIFAIGAAGLARGEPRSAARDEGPMLEYLARAAVPLMLLVSGYLLWAGAHRAGGAFQGGAVAAAAGVLLQLAGLLPGWGSPRPWLRWALTAGFLVFLAVAILPLILGLPLLQYPFSWAGTLILAIELSLTFSLALALAGLFLLLCGDREAK